MMRKTITSFGLGLFFAGAWLSASGQQDAQLSMYLRNPVQFNSAHAGSNGLLRTTLIHRAQWVGWEGAPRTQWISAHAPVFRNRIGIGFTGLTDRSGARGHREFMSHVAYHFPKPIKGFRLSTGLSLGVQSNWFDFGDLQAFDPGDPIQAAPYREAAFNAGFGAMAFKDQYYVGFSIPHLIEQPMGFQGTGPVQRRHHYLTAGYVVSINSVIDFRASTLLKKVQGAPMTMDIGGEVWMDDFISVGAMVRWREGIGFQASYRHDAAWRFYYAVDVPLNGLINRNFGSHEIGISWDFGPMRPAFQSPRFF